MEFKIRSEEEKDYQEIYDLVKLAFSQAEHSDGNEQDLVNRLRAGENYIPQLALVAEVQNKVVGYVMFTKLKYGEENILILAPIAVLPEYQKQNIGGELIKKGHEIARELGYKGVHLVGYPDYYKKFGYKSIADFEVVYSYDLPKDVVMLCELEEGYFKRNIDELRYPKEFGL